MKVKELIKNVCLLVGDKSLAEYAENGTDLGGQKQEYENLLTLVNLVVNETIAYVPLLTEEKIVSESKKIYYSTLKKKAIKIYGVFNAFGESIAYKERLDYLEAEDDVSIIKYSFVPEKLTEESEIPYSEKGVVSSVLVYGVTANYCIYQNRFDEACLWNERYVSGIESATSLVTQETKTVKNSFVKGRNFL